MKSGTPLIAALLAFGSASPAAAFVCTRASTFGPSLGWEDRTVELRPHASSGEEVSHPEIVDALAFAAAQWTDVDCADFAFVVGPSTDEDRVGFDWRQGTGAPTNQNIVVFRRGSSADIDAWLHPLGAIAITTVTFVRRTGRIVDADVEMNDAGYEFTACDEGCMPVHDLKNTLTHELGHVLGLDHPPPGQPGAEEATMYGSAPAGDLSKRDLAEDDVAGLCTLYPKGQPLGECYGVGRPAPVEVEVREVGCSATSSPSGALWLLLAALAARAWRTQAGTARVAAPRSGMTGRSCRA